jgi:hypothetical protein
VGPTRSAVWQGSWQAPNPAECDGVSALHPALSPGVAVQRALNCAAVCFVFHVMWTPGYWLCVWTAAARHGQAGAGLGRLLRSPSLPPLRVLSPRLMHLDFCTLVVMCMRVSVPMCAFVAGRCSCVARRPTQAGLRVSVRLLFSVFTACCAFATGWCPNAAFPSTTPSATLTPQLFTFPSRLRELRFLAAGSLEEKVYQRQLSKEGLQV